MDLRNRTNIIKAESTRLGFEYCGISHAEFLEEEAPLLERWLKNGFQGKMKYMENHFDKRLDPRRLVEGTKSVISLLLNYYPGPPRSLSRLVLSGAEVAEGNGGEVPFGSAQPVPFGSAQPVPFGSAQGTGSSEQSGFQISKYAYGTDYHLVIKEKLSALLNFIKTEIGDVHGRAFVDSAPVMDKAWAKRSGLGWMGKHTNLINKNSGSFFFIAELLVDLELEADSPVEDFCGTCTKCIDACPTDAIVQPYVVDASKCISYLTIELKDKIPNEFSGKTDNWIFGCDVCQDVCPWNRFSHPHHEKHFEPKKEILEMKQKDWLEITEEVFEKTFHDSPLKRTGYERMKRNLEFALKKNADEKNAQ